MRNFSFFNPPIASQKDAKGNVIQTATVKPCGQVDVARLHQYITTNVKLHTLTEQVRASPDMRAAKASLLPYVLPCGVFSYRNSNSMKTLSGLLPIDVDHLSSHEEAVALRQQLFDDPILCPVLCYISPSGMGVKAFVPYPLPPDGVEEQMYVGQWLKWAMEYVATMYGKEHVDTSGKDLSRACFLCHDDGALLRIHD